MYTVRVISFVDNADTSRIVEYSYKYVELSKFVIVLKQSLILLPII